MAFMRNMFKGTIDPGNPVLPNESAPSDGQPLKIVSEPDGEPEAVRGGEAVEPVVSKSVSFLNAIPEAEPIRIPLNGATGSWSSASGMTTTRAVDRTSFNSNSWASAGRAENDTDSFDSTVTDFDYLTSPGAQAERNAEYQQAIRMAQQACGGYPGLPMPGATGYWPGVAPNAPFGPPQGFAPWYNFAPPAALNPQAQHPAFAKLSQARRPSDGADAAELQLKAAELDVYATHLMAQAMQAKAEVLRLQSGAGPASAMQPMPTGAIPVKPRVSIDLNTVTLPGQGQHLQAESASNVPENERTTIMLRNVPNDYTRDMLLDLLDENGFVGSYDFVYLPMDFKRKVGLGYAFVNMASRSDADRAFVDLDGFNDWKIVGSSKVLEIAWGNPLQGLTAHVDRYRNSPMMHPEVPDEFRPLLFTAGVRTEFPPPTRKIRAPRFNHKTEESCQRTHSELSKDSKD